MQESSSEDVAEIWNDRWHNLGLPRDDNCQSDSNTISKGLTKN